MMEKWQKDVLKSLEEQTRYINQTFKDLALCINAYFEGNHEQVDKIILKISAAEKQAGKLKDSALTKVASAESSIHRTDYLRLVLQLAEVASYQGGSAVRLGKIPFQPKNDDPMIVKSKMLIEVFLQVGDKLSSVAKALGDDMVKAEKICEELNQLEENVDDRYRDLEAHLYNRKDLDIRDILQLRSVFLHIEEACDIVQRVSDSIRIIIITH